MYFIGRVLFFVLILFETGAEARIFNMAQATFGAYLRGTYAPGPYENTLNSESNGNNVTLNSDYQYNMSGEFGFSFAKPFGNIRIGLEYLRPPDGKDASGTYGGAEAYTLTSEISVLVPKAELEINLKKWQASKVYLLGGIGYASLVARNSYTVTAAGTAQFGLSDFSEDIRGNTVMYEGGFGFESVMSDMTTFIVEAGYRSLKFETVEHNREAVNFQGSVSQHDRATNMDGTSRTLDMSGGFAAFGFRFWIK